LEQQRAGLGDGSYDATYYLQEQQRRRSLNSNERMGDGGIPEGGYAAVRAEIAKVLTDSKPFFPADFAPPVGPNYGGLFIRLAWHCSGSYRESDGRGGCDGGRIRFDPELNWPDNANLNQALRVLEPVKDMFGSTLSWGDLIVLAGDTAIQEMGGPTLGFCGGRIDDEDGANSLILGPSDVQEKLTPCVSIGQQGRCQSPLGPTTVGLIYVNPAGPEGAKGDPAASGLDIRDAFSRMGFSDRETVALIGGGHAFGKCHGACADPPCGRGTDLEGIGPNTFTSGFEGAWTTIPTTWSNMYFNNLFDYNWNITTGPGGALQWEPENGPDIMMLTSDIALSVDPIYQPISEEYASNLNVLEDDFAAAWYRLTSADMGSPARCLGDDVPEPQFWQDSFPAYAETVPDFVPIRTSIQSLIDEDSSNIAAFANLAWGCASSFRETDYRGGCNGGRIRFSPEKDWPMNAGASATLAILEAVKTDEISSADLIVLAGQTAVEAAGGNPMAFCGARVDSDSGEGSAIYAPTDYAMADDNYLLLQDKCFKMGLTNEQCTATFAVPTSGSTLSNAYFVALKADDGDFSEIEQSLLLGDFAPIVDSCIDDNEKFLAVFADAWTQMMSADRYMGPGGNYCKGTSHPTLESDTGGAPTGAPTPSSASTVGTMVASAVSAIVGLVMAGNLLA
jgi:catalase-peroxidase